MSHKLLKYKHAWINQMQHSNKSAVLSLCEKRMLNSFIDRLKNELGDTLYRVILFGSKARGDSRRGSDIDILLLLKNRTLATENMVFESLTSVQTQSVGHWIGISPKIYSTREWSFRRNINTPFFQEVQRDGIQLT